MPLTALSWVVSRRDTLWNRPGVVVERPTVRQGLVDAMEVVQAVVKTAMDDCIRNIVSPLGHPRTYATYSEFRRRQGQEDQFNQVSMRPPTRNQAGVKASTERGLESETLSRACPPVDFLQHQPACSKRGSLGRKWRQTGGDQVRIDEIRTLPLARQKLPRERGLACPVRSGDDDNLLIRFHAVLTVPRPECRNLRVPASSVPSRSASEVHLQAQN